ncbi:MAG TPA: MaoC family dehydratase [Aestuariivirgaceae bacterium]|jgi:2-methylfumaryl-CoA hydratase
MSKARAGNFFEDFSAGEVILHGLPRTLTSSDQTLYTALYGSRFTLQQSEDFAQRVGYPKAPLDDLLVFHMVFGKTVNDISLNAIANLGYADCHFLRPVYAGDTLIAESRIIGLKENSSGKSGTVHVRSKGINQKGETVLEFVRWVMVRKREERASCQSVEPPRLPEAVDAESLGGACPPLAIAAWNWTEAGATHRLGDYHAGERIDHIDGMTVEEAEHMMAARLYHNNARVHFNAWQERAGRFGKRIVYGGHAMSMARALTHNGLANAFHVAAINGGRHVAPLFAGDTVFAWSEILETRELPGRSDVGGLRILTRATRDQPAGEFPRLAAKENVPGVILELDYWALMPI